MKQDDEEFLRGLADASRVTRRTLLRFGIGAAGRASEPYALGADFQGGEA